MNTVLAAFLVLFYDLHTYSCNAVFLVNLAQHRSLCAGISRPTRVLDVAYNASNNELVRTKTLVKNAVIQIDATPFRQWYLQHYGQELGRKAESDAKVSKATAKKHEARQKNNYIDPAVADQFKAGRLLAIIASRPGQSGRCDGEIRSSRRMTIWHRALICHEWKQWTLCNAAACFSICLLC
jgi:ribosomal protein S8E